MVRSKKGIETMVNLINISYCAMKILPYKDEAFSQYKDTSVQEIRLALSQQINQQVIFATFVKNVETIIKSVIHKILCNPPFQHCLLFHITPNLFFRNPHITIPSEWDKLKCIRSFPARFLKHPNLYIIFCTTARPLAPLHLLCTL